MPGHFMDMCKHDIVIRQCRCPAKDKTVTRVECPPSHASFEDLPPAVEPNRDHEALIALIRRISPIKQEPLATAVAEEWAAEFEKDGWHR